MKNLFPLFFMSLAIALFIVLLSVGGGYSDPMQFLLGLLNRGAQNFNRESLLVQGFTIVGIGVLASSGLCLIFSAGYWSTRRR